MSDTIELLETIGSDASLRHASSEALSDVLQQAQASAALTAAVVSGDSTLLFAELGHKVNLEPQATQTSGYEDDEPNEEDLDTSGDSTPGSSTTSEPTK